jgi:hypothetical protein
MRWEFERAALVMVVLCLLEILNMGISTPEEGSQRGREPLFHKSV